MLAPQPGVAGEGLGRPVQHPDRRPVGPLHLRDRAVNVVGEDERVVHLRVLDVVDVARAGRAQRPLRVDDRPDGAVRRPLLDVVAPLGAAVGRIERDRLVRQHRDLVRDLGHRGRQVFIHQPVHRDPVDLRVGEIGGMGVDPHVRPGVVHHHARHVVLDAVPPHVVAIVVEDVRRASAVRVWHVLPGGKEAARQRAGVVGRDLRLDQPVHERARHDRLVIALALAAAVRRR